MPKKSPFRGYSLNEVSRMESGYYVLQFGGDFLTEDHSYLFTRSEVIKLYNSTLKDLVDIIESGDEKERLYALDLIPKLIATPMRLH